MTSWLRNVECKAGAKGSEAPGPPKLDHFNFQGDQEDVEDIAKFMDQFGSNYSVLNVDFKQELLILVKTADGVDIKNKPFLNRAQRQSAIEILCIPFQVLDEVEKIIAPKVSHVINIFLHSTGRCGSTLLCKALEELSTVQAVSEPDVYTIIAMAEHARTDDRLFKGMFSDTPQPHYETLVSLTRISTLLLNYYFISLVPEKSSICYKMRSSVLDGAEVLQEAVPSAKTIYLYRNCYAFSESWVRVFLQDRYSVYWLLTTSRLDAWYLYFISSYLAPAMRPYYEVFMGNSPKYDNAPFRHGFLWSFAHFWWTNVEKATSLIRKDPDNFFHAVLRYEDLIKRRQELVLKVAQSLGIVSDLDKDKELGAIAAAFESNSQAGSSVESRRNVEDASDVWFGEWENKWCDEVLAYIGDEVKAGDYVIPGTM